MVDDSNRRVWGYRIAYCGLTAFLAFLYLLPLQSIVPYWAAPDLILGLTYFWSLRRPYDLPIVLIALVVFMADLLFQRPPGLFAAITVIGCEFLRSRAPVFRETRFVIEWLMVGVVITLSLIGNRLILKLALVPTSALSTDLLHIFMTVACVPLIVILFRWGISIGRLQRDAGSGRNV